MVFDGPPADLTAEGVSLGVHIEWLRLRRRASADVALTVFLYTGITAGVVLTGLAGSLNSSVLTYRALARAASLAPGGSIVLVAAGAFVATAAVDVGRRRARPTAQPGGNTLIGGKKETAMQALTDREARKA